MKPIKHTKPKPLLITLVIKGGRGAVSYEIRRRVRNQNYRHREIARYFLISYINPIYSQFKPLLTQLRVNTHNAQETTLIHANMRAYMKGLNEYVR